VEVAVHAPQEKAEEAGRVVARLKQEFIGCRRIAQRSAGAASLEGRLRVRARVAASGQVVAIDLPIGNRDNPEFDPDTDGAPRPNPSQPLLSRRFLPCVEARLLQSRFGAADGAWTFTVDVRIR